MAAVGKVIRSLLSSVNSGKVYPQRAEQTAQLPLIVYSIIDGVPINEKQGSAPVDVYRVQVDIYAEKYSELDTLSAAVRSAMDDQRNQTIAGEKVIIIRWDDARDLFDKSTREHHRSEDYIVRIRN